jgi:DNA polymerase-3 subunit delta
MEIKHEQLTTHLQKGLQPVYLIATDEHLLLQESCQQIIQTAKAAGHTETEVLTSERGFNWQSLQDANASMSLFGEKKLIDLRIPNGKPERQGSDAIVQYLENASPDNILLIRCPQLNKQSLNAKWIKTIKSKGLFCLIWKVKAGQLPSWIQQRARKYNLQLERDAAQILAERVEGNLLAAHQELEKLGLLFPEGGQLHSKHIIQTVASNSRYDVFSMVEQALSQNGEKALLMFRGLREERTDMTIIAWALRNELAAIYQIADRCRKENIAAVYKDMRVWESKQRLYRQVMNRLDLNTLGSFISDLALLDRTIKGRAPGSADDLCEDIILRLSGVSLPLYESG